MDAGPLLALSPVGAAFLVLGSLAWMHSRAAFIVVLSLSMPLVTTAGLTLGSSSVPPFFLLAVPATWSALLGVMHHGLPHKALRLLMAFVAWSAVVTVVGPLLFAGMLILEPRAGIDSAILFPTPLSFTMTMAAQLAYLVLGAGVAVFLTQQHRLSPGTLTPGVVAGTVVSAASLLPDVKPWVDTLFRVYASASFNPFEVRHTGIYSEPSYLAVFSLTAVVYCLHRSRVVSGWQRAGLVTTAGLAAWNGYLTHSATFAASLAIAAVAVIVLFTGRALMRGVRATAALIFIGLLIVAVIGYPVVEGLIEVVAEKFDTNSYANRTESNRISLQIVVDSWGLGVGLGSNRPSSFALLLLSNVGLIGVGLFAAAVIRAVRGAYPHVPWRPAISALLALLLAKVLAEPALSTPMLWLTLGMVIHAAALPRNGDPDAHPDPADAGSSESRTTRAHESHETSPGAPPGRRQADSIAVLHAR